MSVDVKVIKNKLLVKYPFFGGIVANLNFIEDVGCVDYNGNPTAATDGKNVYYHADFINSLSEEKQIFVFAHEICHIAFDHIFRSEGKDRELWNIATDAVINALLKQDGLELIECGIDIPEAINYNAEEMYEKLLEDKKRKQSSKNPDTHGGTEQNNNYNKSTSQNSSNETSSSNSGRYETNSQSNSMTSNDDCQKQVEQENKDVGHDTHSLWDKAIENKNRQIEENSSEEKKGKNEHNFWDKIFNRNKENNIQQNQTLKSSESEQEKQEQIKKISEMGEQASFKQNKIERKKQLEELRDILAKQSMGAGNSTNSSIRQIENIGYSMPLIDWRKLLKEAAKIEVDWSYQNASIEDGVVTAHLEENPQSETEILLDTSGSIDEILLKNFLRECKNILQTSKIKVGCFDTKFYGFHEIRTESDIDNIQFVGGGGTDFDVAVESFSRRVENKIIFTDGDADMPTDIVDAIWIVFGDKKINPPGGRVIYISQEQLQKLCLAHNNELSHGKIR